MTGSRRGRTGAAVAWQMTDERILGDAMGHDSSVVRRLGLPPTIRACLFDLDGVLTETATIHARAWKRVFDEYLRTQARTSGGPFVPFDAVREYAQFVDGKRRSDGARSFLTARGIHLAEGTAGDPPSADTIHGIGARKQEVFRQLLREEGVRVFPGSLRYLQAVRNAGLLAAVVSSSSNCHAVLVAAGLDGLLDVRVDGLVAAARHLAGKPSPDTYLAAAEALGVAPAESAVFEDATAGIEAGRAGHFGYVVGVDRLGHGDELHRHGATVVVRDLCELMEVP